MNILYFSIIFYEFWFFHKWNSNTFPKWHAYALGNKVSRWNKIIIFSERGDSFTCKLGLDFMVNITTQMDNVKKLGFLT